MSGLNSLQQLGRIIPVQDYGWITILNTYARTSESAHASGTKLGDAVFLSRPNYNDRTWGKLQIAQTGRILRLSSVPHLQNPHEWSGGKGSLQYARNSFSTKYIKKVAGKTQRETPKCGFLWQNRNNV